METIQTGGAPVARSRRWPLALAGVLVVAAAVSGAFLWQGRGDAAKEYVTVAVDTGTVAPTVIASGTLNPVTTIQVGTHVSGVIQALSCDFNTRVHAGQLCAKLDPRPYQSVVDQAAANLGAARAQLQKDRANLDFARRNLARNVDLRARNFVSQVAVDTAQNAYAQAQAQVAIGEAAIRQQQAILNSARINLGYTSIVSPVDGTVVSRNVTQGQTVAASFQTPTLFLIATDLTKMQVDTNVSESDIGRVAAGNAASFTVEAFPGRTFNGKVTQVRQAPQTVQNVITYNVIISVANPELLLKPGMTAAARIVTERRDHVLRVPEPALRYMPSDSGGGGAGAAGRGRQQSGAAPPAQVWVLREGRPQRVPVVTGLADDAFAEVLGGRLRAGDAVIVSERGGETRPDAGAAPTGPRMPRL